MLSRHCRTRIFRLICLLMLFPAALRAEEAAAPDSVDVNASQLADRIIDAARVHLGKPYRYAANGPDRFDCSGLTKYVYNQFGYTLSRSTSGQTRDGREIKGQLSDLQKGDLVIFVARSSRRTPGHVGIFIALDSTGTDFSFIHAARTGVRVSHYSETYYNQRFLGARRILPDFAEEVQVDSTVLDLLAELADKTVSVKFDTTLVLSPSDRHIILFADGTWGLVDSLGVLSRPASPERLVLSESGAWRSMPLSSIRIPDLQTGSAPAAAAPASQPAPLPADGSEQYHTIVSGDTLSGIAKKYQTTVKKLCELNGISTTSTLRIGRRLRVR